MCANTWYHNLAINWLIWGTTRVEAPSILQLCPQEDAPLDDSQVVEPDSFGDDDDKASDLLEAEDDNGEEIPLEDGEPEVPSDYDLLFESTSPVDFSVEASQPATPIPAVEISDSPDAKINPVHDDEAVENAKMLAMENRASIDDQISAMTIKLNNAKKLLAFFGIPNWPKEIVFSVWFLQCFPYCNCPLHPLITRFLLLFFWGIYSGTILELVSFDLTCLLQMVLLALNIAEACPATMATKASLFEVRIIHYGCGQPPIWW